MNIKRIEVIENSVPISVMSGNGAVYTYGDVQINLSADYRLPVDVSE